MPGLTTNSAPPLVAPEMILIAEPLLWVHALIAGLGPMNVASMAPEFSASIAAGPALKVWVSSFVLPSACWICLFDTPSTGRAWVRFAK